jgi:hypothetical protein
MFRLMIKSKLSMMWHYVIRPLMALFSYTGSFTVLHCIWKHHHCQWRAAKFRLMFGAQGLWAGRDLYCATPNVTCMMGPRLFRSFPKDRPILSPSLTSKMMLSTYPKSDPHRSPFSRLLWHTRGCWRPVLTLILMGPHSDTSYDT